MVLPTRTSPKLGAEESPVPPEVTPSAFPRARVVARRTVAKSEVVVALVEVLFWKVTFSRVDEPVARRLPNEPVPDALIAVVLAYGKVEAVDEVAV